MQPTALIIGATGGIGQAICEQLQQQGFDLSAPGTAATFSSPWRRRAWRCRTRAWTSPAWTRPAWACAWPAPSSTPRRWRTTCCC